MSQLIDQIQMAGRKSENIIEANISGMGSFSTRYDIKFRSGGTAREVQGPAGLSVGESVVVAVYPGRSKRYVILGAGYKNSAEVKEVWV